MLDLLPSCPGAGCPTHKRSETYCEASEPAKFPNEDIFTQICTGNRTEPGDQAEGTNQHSWPKIKRAPSQKPVTFFPRWSQRKPRLKPNASEQQSNQSLRIHKFSEMRGKDIFEDTEGTKVAQLALTQVCWSLMSFSATPSYDPSFSILSYSIPARYFPYLIWLIHSAYFLNCIYHFNHF